jgi:hypothetical protein
MDDNAKIAELRAAEFLRLAAENQVQKLLFAVTAAHFWNLVAASPPV